MTKWLTIPALVFCLLLGACHDPIADLGQTYTYSVAEGFISYTVVDSNGKVFKQGAIAAFSITSIEAYTTHADTPYLQVKTADSDYHTLYDVTLREFLVLCGEAMGSWMMDIPASQLPLNRSDP
jgi:hypothetical protein